MPEWKQLLIIKGAGFLLMILVVWLLSELCITDHI